VEGASFSISRNAIFSRRRCASADFIADPAADHRHARRAELQTSLAMELSQDFVTETVNTYMPEAQQWCERGRGMFVPQDKLSTRSRTTSPRTTS
jgi:hypothetical protein